MGAAGEEWVEPGQVEVRCGVGQPLTRERFRWKSAISFQHLQLGVPSDTQLAEVWCRAVWRSRTGTGPGDRQGVSPEPREEGRPLRTPARVFFCMWLPFPPPIPSAWASLQSLE